jgi:hypothetical protein
MQCKYHVQETLKTFLTMSAITFCWYVFISWPHGNIVRKASFIWKSFLTFSG